MIRQVIFDFGQVLVHYDPPSMVARYVRDEADAALLTEVVFDRLYWDALDAGTITDDEALDAACKRLPARLHETARDIYWHWIAMLPEIDGMDALLSELKASGVPLYLLSNISKYFAEHADTIPILRHFDGYVFSAVCGKIKPHHDCFEYVCNTFGCHPSETVFVDDNDINIRSANAFGLHGIRFEGDAKTLRQQLKDYGLFA